MESLSAGMLAYKYLLLVKLLPKATSSQEDAMKTRFLVAATNSGFMFCLYIAISATEYFRRFHSWGIKKEETRYPAAHSALYLLGYVAR